jgi:hypothetical protein
MDPEKRPPVTWADGYGRWHASVSLAHGPSAAHIARQAIREELRQRGETRTGAASFFRLIRVGATGHGTVEFREADS